MGVSVVQEERLEVGRTGGEDHLVALDTRSAHGQCHIRKGLRLQELLKDSQQIGAMIVPTQTVLLAVIRVPASAAYWIPSTTSAHALGRHGGWMTTNPSAGEPAAVPLSSFR